MRARSQQLKSRSKPKKDSSGPQARLPRAERRELILEQAGQFFSEYGLTGQTRELASACGVSQRLLYRLFPTKASLLSEVYARTILGPFEGAWLVDLADRTRPIEQRLDDFYDVYLREVLTRKWLRLFLYSSLAEGDMAPSYIASIITRLLETIVNETAAEQGVEVPDDQSLKREIGWALHGAISHLAIRRRIYRGGTEVPEARIARLYIRGFLAGFGDVVREAAAGR